MAKTKKEEAVDIHTVFEKALAGLSLSTAFKLADEYEDIDVKTISTGFPSLDKALCSYLPGLPRARHVEIFAKKESSGKTSITLAIIKEWQDQGLKVGIIDIEKTITGRYLNVHGILTKYDPERPNIHPVRIMRSTIEPDSDEKLNIYLEDVLNTVEIGSAIFDILVVDSVDALVTEEEAQKGAEDRAKVGGISMKLSQFFRKNTNTKATVLWINQTRQSPGAYNPTGGITYVTSGGRALPFYSSIRLELSVIEKLKEGDNEPYGFKVRIVIVKNKISSPWRVVDLNYINGEGFSKTYDYFLQAVKMGFIIKGGAGWYTFIKNKIGENGITKETLLVGDNVIFKRQGELNMYNEIKNIPDILAKLKAKVNGEEIELEEATEAEKEGEGSDFVNPD